MTAATKPSFGTFGLCVDRIDLNGATWSIPGTRASLVSTRIMTHVHAITVALALALALLSSTARADQFAIGLEQVVSNGVPGPGAGFIEVAGGSDTYTLEITRPLAIFAQELQGSCAFHWSMTDPRGATVFFDFAICVASPGPRELLIPGTYTVTVVGTGASVGAYSFILWQLEEPQEFAIELEQTISNGVPAAGAGRLEEPGSIDIYTLEVEAGAAIYVDEIAGNCALKWTAFSPSGAVLFVDGAFCTGDPAARILDETGEWSFVVSAPSGTTGTYSFRLWSLEAPQSFALALGETVASGSPALGAGVLEEPGAIDEYTIALSAGQLVYFDELSGGCGITWRLIDPNGATIFIDGAICVSDPGEISIATSGIHQLVVQGSNGAFGAYSFRTLLVNPPQVFEIGVDEIVSEGMPAAGAGSIEMSGSVDVYLLMLDEDADVCVVELSSSSCSLQWSASTPEGATLFEDPANCVGNPGRFTHLAAGLYTISVSGSNGATGIYSFVVEPGRQADLDGDCEISGGDLGLLLAAWGPCPEKGACDADLDGDGVVGGADLGMLLGMWGE